MVFLFQSPGPIFFEAGPLVVRWYGLLIAIAVLLGVKISETLAQHRGIKPELIGDLSIFLVLGAIPCARAYYVLFQWQSYSQRPEDIIAIWKGGIAIHGAILGGLLASLLFAKLQKISFWTLTDVIMPSLSLGQAIGRWGNFFNAEAFGAPTDLPWKLYIAPPSRPTTTINEAYYHPTFLYESLWNLGVFGLLLWIFSRGTKSGSTLKSGTLLFVYLITYSLGRVWIEALRTDSLMVGPFKIAQLVSIGAIALGIFGLIWLYRWRKPLPDVVKR